MRKKTLDDVIKLYSNIGFNENNYDIGGGISETSFVSRRQEEARMDRGKLTLGNATQMFKKLTGYPTQNIKNLLFNKYSLEWHHSGYNPKTRRMGKTYFVNSEQIVSLAKYFKEKELSL